MSASSEVQAIDALAHDGLRLTRGGRGICSTAAAKDLERRGLVVIIGPADSDGKTEGQRAAEADDARAARTVATTTLPAAEANETMRANERNAPATITSGTAPAPAGRAAKLRGGASKG